MSFLRKYKVFTMIMTIFIVTQTASVESTESADPKEVQAERKPKTENLLSLEYGKLVIDDTCHIFSSPLRWDENDWLVALLGTCSVVGVAAFADKPVKNALQKNRTDANDSFARAIQPFGSKYSFGVLGAFEAGGILFHDDNARAVAQDGLASSIIAAGIITPSLKYAFGRRRPHKSHDTYRFSPFSGDDSFPSGHATQAFAVASVVAEHYDSPIIKIGAYGLAATVAYARMEQNKHWASDVLAGALIGTFVGREIVHFNHDKRYEMSLITDEDMVGIQISHKF